MTNNAGLPSVRKTRKALSLIFLVMLMDVMGITMLSPVAPQIVLRFSSQAVMVTMITVVYACGQVIAAPLIGKLGDRYGRRPVLLVSILGQSLGYLIFGLGGSLWVLFLGRLIGGITAGNLSTAGAYIADVSTPEERSKNFTIIGSAWSLGLIFGPMIGGVLGQFSLETPAFAAAGFALLNVLLGYFLLPESLPVEKRHPVALNLRDYNPISSIIDMARKPGLGILLLVNAVFSFAFNGVASTSALFIIEKFFAVTWQISLLMIVAGVSVAISNTFIVPRVIPRAGERRSGTFSLVGLAIFYTIIFYVPNLWLVYPMNMLASCMNSFVFPVLTSLSANCVETHEMGILMGVISAVGSLTNIFGPLWAGLVYDHIMLGAPYWMGALLLLLAAVMLSRVRTPARLTYPS
ncbi:MAG TPA: MFS transporter [Anaerolineales bacterium]|nr:MFS transporter [Anaerolineales bacterium]